MTPADIMYHKKVELRETFAAMKDVSPATSTHAKLKEKADRLQIELSDLGAKRAKTP